MTQFTQGHFEFHSLHSRQVTAAFDGGKVSSDGAAHACAGTHEFRPTYKTCPPPSQRCERRGWASSAWKRPFATTLLVA